MLRIEWEDTWINSLIDAGFSPNRARTIYRAMYGEGGPKYNKNPSQEAMVMLEKIKLSVDFSSFLAEINTRNGDNSPIQRS